MDQELQAAVDDLGSAASARNREHADGMYDALHLIKSELRSPSPSLDYIRCVVERAIPTF